MLVVVISVCAFTWGAYVFAERAATHFQRQTGQQDLSRTPSESRYRLLLLDLPIYFVTGVTICGGVALIALRQRAGLNLLWIVASLLLLLVVWALHALAILDRSFGVFD